MSVREDWKNLLNKEEEVIEILPVYMNLIETLNGRKIINIDNSNMRELKFTLDDNTYKSYKWMSNKRLIKLINMLVEEGVII